MAVPVASEAGEVLGLGVAFRPAGAVSWVFGLRRNEIWKGGSRTTGNTLEHTKDARRR